MIANLLYILTLSLLVASDGEVWSFGLNVLWLSSSAGCHDDVEIIVQAAVKHNVCVIPFGGGLVMSTQCIHSI